MLYRTHVMSALEARRGEFVSFQRGMRDEVGELAARLRALAGRKAEDVRRESDAEGERPSYPSDELERAGGAVVRFEARWRSRRRGAGPRACSRIARRSRPTAASSFPAAR